MHIALPGAYQKLVSSGRVLLVIEEGHTDPAGGYEGGVAMAQRGMAVAVRTPSDAANQLRGLSPRSVPQDVAEFVDNAAGPTVPPEGIRLVVP